MLGGIAWYTRPRPHVADAMNKTAKVATLGNGARMELQHWQAQFDNWLKNHHQHQDAAHDLCHFRRVWATAQKLAADDDVDMLVYLTACYFTIS